VISKFIRGEVNDIEKCGGDETDNDSDDGEDDDACRLAVAASVVIFVDKDEFTIRLLDEGERFLL
jgi:hypothetical protein